MLTPFSTADLGRIFDARSLTRGRSLVLLGTVQVTLRDTAIDVVVDHLDLKHSASISTSSLGPRVVFTNRCSCGQPSCAHLAAGALAALDRHPSLRKPVQHNFMASLTAPAAEERQQLLFELSPGRPPDACYVATLLVGERTGRREPTTPGRILADRSSPETVRIMARMLGGDAERTAVAPGAVASVLELLARMGKARWQATGKPLRLGEERAFQANVAPNLPPKSAVILGAAGPWYVDGATGAVGRVRLRQAPAPRLTPRPVAPPPRRRAEPVLARVAEPIIHDCAATPVLQLRQFNCPDEFGNLQLTDALAVDFDYEGVLTPADDERQFVRVQRPGDLPGAQSFLRRDRAAEAAAMATLHQDGFSQMRIAEGATAKGRTVLVFRGRDAAERWQAFTTDRVPALQALGWRSLIDRSFGPRIVQSVGEVDMRIADAELGSFALDFGIEIDGMRVPLLPILSRLLDRGGIDAAQIVDGEVITSLDDGRILKLPAERMRRLLAVMSDLLEAAQRTADGGLILPEAKADAVGAIAAARGIAAEETFEDAWSIFG